MSIVFSVVFCSVVFCPTVMPAVGGSSGVIWNGLIWSGVSSGGGISGAVPGLFSCALSLAGTRPGGDRLFGFRATFGEEGAATPIAGGGPSLCASRDANRAASGSLPGGPAGVSPEARPGGIPAAKVIGPVLMSGGILTSFMGCYWKYRQGKGGTRGQKIARRARHGGWVLSVCLSVWGRAARLSPFPPWTPRHRQQMRRSCRRRSP